MKVEILHVPGCARTGLAAALVAEVVRASAPAAQVTLVPVESLEDAERLGFPGSPTVRVDGVDVDPEAPRGVGLG